MEYIEIHKKYYDALLNFHVAYGMENDVNRGHSIIVTTQLLLNLVFDACKSTDDVRRTIFTMVNADLDRREKEKNDGK